MKSVMRKYDLKKKKILLDEIVTADDSSAWKVSWENMAPLFFVKKKFWLQMIQQHEKVSGENINFWYISKHDSRWFISMKRCLRKIWLHYYIPRIRRIGGCYGFTSKPPAVRRPPPAARHPPPAARNGVNAITQKPLDGLFSNLVYTLVVIVSWPD